MSRILPMGLVAACLLLTGCTGGTWEDDPRNWSRAFHDSRPADGITVVHSRYWRSGHWSAEYEWFFELRLGPAELADMRTNPDFLAVPQPQASERKSNAPAWFLPKPLAAYAVYALDSDPEFLIFVEVGTDTVFWTKCQL